MYVNMVSEKVRPPSAVGKNAHWCQHSETTFWHELVNLKCIYPMIQYSLSWMLILEDEYKLHQKTGKRIIVAALFVMGETEPKTT